MMQSPFFYAFTDTPEADILACSRLYLLKFPSLTTDIWVKCPVY